MKKIFYLIMLAACAPAFSQGYLYQDGQEIKNGNNQNVLLRGLGLGGWMIQEGYMLQTGAFAGPQHEIRQKITDLIGEERTEAFYQAYRENGITKRDIDSLKAWGFNSVRLPMHYNLYTLPTEMEPVEGQNTWLDEGFTRTDQLLQWCKENEMYLILDMHATPGGQGVDANISDYDDTKPSLWESPANKEKLVALWRRLADRYKDEPWVGAYDLINEPNWNFTGTNQNGCDEGSNAPLRQIMVDITAAIREVDTNHMIIIEGNCWGNNYNGIFPLWDTNMTLSFHKYWNDNSTGSIQGMLNFRSQYNVPIWLGESGENSNVWFRDAIKLMEDNNIGWSFWPVKKVESIAGITDVTKTAGYQSLLNYWGGSGAAPTADEATAILMELAENFKMENVTVKYDVIDAMFRQVASNETLPYKNHPLPGKVFATEYDLGRYQYAYNDAEVATYHSGGGSYVNWNQGWSMRNDGVDIQPCTDAVTNGFQVGYTNTGEWLLYTLTNENATAYDLDIRYAGFGGSMHLEDENGRISENVTFASTGGYSTWSTSTISGIVLKAGTSKVKLVIDNAGFNLNFIEFKNPVDAAAADFKVIDAATNVLGDKVIVMFNKPLQSGINLSQSNLSVKINGNAATITSYSDVTGNSFVLTLSTAINPNDVVLLTYAGTNIIAADATVQTTFTDMPVANRLGTILQIPGTIQAENFYVNNGLSLETTTDAGSGQNIGYTDSEDYLDYLVNINETSNYRIEYRTAGESQRGEITLQLINAATQDIQVVALNSTGGWQNWQTTVTTAQLPAGRYFMRVKVNAGGFNFNWVKFTAIAYDDDVDGVPNSLDLCPDTPAGTVVDFNGCSLFTLPGNNFTVLVADETCRTSNNGSIAITSASNHNFVATLSGQGSQTANFSTNTTLANLGAGTYELCITLPEAPAYKQCFDVVIEEPRDLSVLSRVSNLERTVNIDLYGGTIYTITLNNQTITTTRSTVSLALNPGVNSLVVKADNDCQGIYSETINLSTAAVVYPNPVSGTNLVNVAIPTGKEKISIQVYSTLGKRVFVNEYNPENGMPTVDMSQLQSGIYIMKIVSGTYTSNVKIVKE